jgi:ribosome-associated protein
LSERFHQILPNLRIPDAELSFEATGAGGPGGQHVNKTDSAIALKFDVAQSPSLSEYRRQRILEQLSTRINREGILRVTARRERSQHRNRALAIERFIELLRMALHEDKARRATKATRGSQRRRIETKKRRGDVKQQRSKRWRRDD